MMEAKAYKKNISKTYHISQSLHPKHLEDLRKSGLSDETILQAGIRSVPPHMFKKVLGFSVPGIVSMYEIPYPNMDGYSRFKVFYAEGKEGPKYFQKKDSPNRFYIPHDVWKVLNDAKFPLYIVEGEKKALKGVQEGIPCIAIGGLWNWKQNGEPIADMNLVVWENRTVYLVPDSDWKSEPYGKKKNLVKAVYELAEELQRRGSTVWIVYLPHAENGEKIGLDDYLCSHSIDEFHNLPKEKYATLKDLIQQANAENYRELIFKIAKLKDAIQRELYAKMLAKRLNVSQKTVYAEVENTRKEIGKKDVEEEKQREGEKIREMFGLDYVPEIPQSFKIADGILFKIEKIKGISIEKEICPAFVISSVIHDEKPKIILKSIKKEAEFDISFSANPDFITILGDFLVYPIEKANTGSLQAYIASYYALNRNKMKSIIACSKIGWRDGIFYLPTRQHRDVVWTNYDIIQAITQKGTVEKQMEIIRQIINTPAGITIIASLTAPLLRVLEIDNFCLNLSGLTGTGKSTAASIACSIWGNPDKMRGIARGTSVGYEIFVSQWRDLIAWLDELQIDTVHDLNRFISFVYEFFQQTGKLRGTKTLNLRSPAEYRGILMTTYETDIETIMSKSKSLRLSAPMGLHRRVIEIPFSDDTYKDFKTGKGINFYEIHKEIHKNYGHVGPLWIEWVEKNIDVIREKFEEVMGEIRCQKIEGIETAYASLLTTASILSQHFSLDCTEISNWILSEIIPQHSEKLSKTRNIIKDFLWDLKDYVMMNKDKFKNMGEIVDPKNIWGEIKGKDVFMLSTAFTEMCEKLGYTKKFVVQQLYKKGRLKLNDTGTLTYKYYLNEKYVRGYYIMDVFEEEE